MTPRVEPTSSGTESPANEGVRASGAPARGYSWPPFEPGNTVALRHGAYAVIALKPRAAELTDRLIELAGDGYEPKYQAAIEAGAMAGARLERAMGRLLDEDVTEEALLSLSGDARAWLRTYLEALALLGLTPKSGGEGGGAPTTFVVVSAFPDTRPAASLQCAVEPDAEIEGHEVRELEDGGF